MKSLLSIIQESSGQNICMAFSHDEPNYTYIITGISKDFEKIMSQYDWEYTILNHKPGLLVYGSHSDEHPWAFDCDPKLKSLADIKRSVLKDAKEAIEYWKEQGGCTGEWKVSLVGDYVYDLGCDFDDLKDADPKKMADAYIEYIQDSYVDGDSNEVQFVVNVEKQQEILKGSTTISFYTEDEWIKFLENGE